MQQPDRFRFAARLSTALAAVLAVSSLLGIVLPSAYARETQTWGAQGTGQDWADLVLVSPLLAVCGRFADKGSRAYQLLLGGALVYALYSFVLYAFSMHHNTLFLLYVAGLGLSFFGTWSALGALGGSNVRSWFSERAPRRAAGWVLVVMSGMFALLWLSEEVPALVNGTVPRSVVEAGLMTNPVHVLDLAVVLPAMLVAGVSLVRGRTLGFWLGPVLLAFGVVLDVALVAMVVSMHFHGVPSSPAVACAMAVVGLVGATLLALLLRAMHRPE